MTNIEAFIAGWKAANASDIKIIEAFSKDWTPNGPSIAAANAIIKELKRTPVPRPENLPTPTPNPRGSQEED